MNSLIPSEHDEQVHVIQWCELMKNHDKDYGLIFAIPNGGQRNKVTAARLKAEGVKPGVPDLFLPVPRGIYAGMFIEMKRRKGGKVSPEQRWWITALISRGYKCVVARGADEAIEAITVYMEGDGYGKYGEYDPSPEGGRVQVHEGTRRDHTARRFWHWLLSPWRKDLGLEA